MSPGLLFDAFWSVWALSWIAAAMWSSDTLRRPARMSWCPALLIVGGIVCPGLSHVLFGPAPHLWTIDLPWAYGLAFATLPGFLFAWWARVHLGALWSAAIAHKRDHRLIKTGPYAITRHPIYTGLLWSALMTDLAAATLPALVGFAALLCGLALKARAEERFLGAELGSMDYATYRRSVPMLLPLFRF